MNFIKTKLDGVLICEPAVFGDARGYFCETFRLDLLEKFCRENSPASFGGADKFEFCQDNESFSNAGVLRGLHFQLPPHAQTKLVRVVKGRVLDVAVDIRRGSATFGQFVSVELSGENKRQFLVPRGFAHGFLVLEDETVFAYKVDNYYSRECDRGVLWSDENIGVNWGDFFDVSRLNLSAKDLVQPRLNEAKELF